MLSWTGGEMMSKAWMENDEAFQAFLATGREYEDYVCEMLRGNGFYARTHERSYRESIDQIEQYKNQIDVTVFDKDYVDIRIEVKSRDYTFTSPLDFPFPDPMVTTVKSWEQCDEEARPQAFACVSQHTGAIIVLNAERTREYWGTVTKPDYKRGFDETSYVCHKKHWRPFSALIKWLEPQCNRFKVGDPDPYNVEHLYPLLYHGDVKIKGNMTQRHHWPDPTCVTPDGQATLLQVFSTEAKVLFPGEHEMRMYDPREIKPIAGVKRI
jgi:hypothetical protein